MESRRVMECTELPPYSDALRSALGIPVFDAITCCDFFIRSRMDNPRVGESKWQAKWDGMQETYKFGQNIAAAELHEIVNRDALGNIGVDNRIINTSGPGKENIVEVPEYLKRQTPALGVIRLDYDYAPAIGDVSHPGSFSYPAYYRCVPGLTFQMCKEGKIEGKVAEEWEA